MTASTQIFRAEWVVPVAAPPIHRGEVLVDPQGRIAAVAPVGAVELGENAMVHDLGNAILLPGLVNVHAHPELAMLRGFLEDLPFRDWILRLVGARRTILEEEDSLTAARWTAVEALAAGITTIAATESSGAAARALTEAGMRGVVYQEVFGPHPAQADDSIRQLYLDLERTGAAAGPLVRVGISPHAPYTVSDDLYRAATRMAREEDLPMAVHIAESSAERELVTRGGGDFAAGLRARNIATPARARGPIQLLRNLDVLSVAPLLIHCVDVDEDDVAAIAAAGAPVAHCPIANARLGHGVAPVPELIAAGVVVGIGTDSVASNNRLDLLEEARVTSLLQRVRLRDPGALSPVELIRLVTIDGARALGLQDRVGTLEPGKDADLCAVSLASPAGAPIHDPLAALFHSLRGSDVVLTVVAGRILYRDGDFKTVDTRAVRKQIEVVGARLRESG